MIHFVSLLIITLINIKYCFFIKNKVKSNRVVPHFWLILQRVLEHCTDELHCQFIVDEILESVCSLAQDQYGNYVTQVCNSCMCSFTCVSYWEVWLSGSFLDTLATWFGYILVPLLLKWDPGTPPSFPFLGEKLGYHQFESY